MQTLRNFLNQAMLIWTESTGAGRLGIALLGVICVLGIVSVGVWSSQPNYVQLATELSPEKAAQVQDALAAADINFTLGGSGAVVLVPSSDLPKARVATAKLGINFSVQAMEPTTPWMDPLTQQEAFRRNLERSIENSVVKYKTVKSVEVHLSIPKKQSFIRPRDVPTAAVVVESDSMVSFGETEAQAIAAVVANSVPGLVRDKVSVSDTEGNVYSTNRAQGSLGWQKKFQTSIENDLMSKAELLIAPVVGYGNASVVVSTEYSFPNSEIRRKEFDPESKVILEEEEWNKTINGIQEIQSGAAGSASNVDDSPVASTRNDGITNDKRLKTRMEYDEMHIHEQKRTPVREMMTVAVLVNKGSIAEESAEQVKTQVTDLVSRAVGLRDTTDDIVVELIEFKDPFADMAPPATAIPWEQINQILKNVSLGFAALVALFIAMRALKSFQPNQVLDDTPEPVSDASQLSQLVKENPEVFSKIIANWSSLEAKPENESTAEAA